MAVINTVLLDSGAEEGAYVANAFELDLVGAGKTRKAALDELIGSLKVHIDEIRGNPDCGMFPGGGLDKGVAAAMKEAMLNPKKYLPKVRNITGYATLHVYDMTGQGFKTDE